MKNFLILFTLAFIFIGCDQKSNVEKDVNVKKENLILIDVRTPAEYKESHLNRAINIPLDEIEKEIEATVKNKDAKIVLHCKSGNRASKALVILKNLGYSDVTNVGGLEDARKIYPD